MDLIRVRRRLARLVLAAAAAFVTALVQPVRAAEQEAHDTTRLAEGDRIRFVAPPEYPVWVKGDVVSLDDGVLRVDRMKSHGGPLEIYLADVTRLELGVGRERHTLLGLGIGTGVGLVLGGLLAWAFCEDPDTVCDGFEEVPVIVGVVTLPFAAVGGLLGTFTYDDVWEEIPLP